MLSKWWIVPTRVDQTVYQKPSLKPNWESNVHLEEPVILCISWIHMICPWATQLIIQPLSAVAISSTRRNILRNTLERSQSPIMELWHRCRISTLPWTLEPSLGKVLIMVVEITQQLVEAENQQLIVMLIHSTSLIRPTTEASFRMVADHLMVKIKALTLDTAKQCKTTVLFSWTNRTTIWIWATSALGPIPPLQDSIIQTSRPNLQITWWTRPRVDSNRAYRITIDLRLALWTQIIIKEITMVSFKTTSCCQKQVQMRVCWRPSIIVNSLRVEARKINLLPMGSDTYQIIYTLNIVTQPKCKTQMVRKEQFKVWRCTYERRATVQCLITKCLRTNEVT